MAGLYLHIPFCKQACHYCDFHFSTNRKAQGNIVEALCKEIILRKDFLANETLETIYLGGGTPSLLSELELEKIFSKVSNSFSIIENPEVTLEANPDDLTANNLSAFRESGINRLSIGIQSFHDPFLKFMNRAHDSTEALECISSARKAGFQNISIDLIYGFPASDHSIWQKDIETALGLEAEHISSYCLTIEDNTALGRWTEKGKFTPSSEEFQAEQYEMLIDRLSSAGYEHYEISNFAKPGFRSRHNMSYWVGKKYLGIGPSAHSYDGEQRIKQVSSNSQYLISLENDHPALEIENLSVTDRINEELLTGLRTSWGVSLADLKKKYAYDLLKDQNHIIEKWSNYLDLDENKDILKLNRKGKLLADEITVDFFLV